MLGEEPVVPYVPDIPADPIIASPPLPEVNRRPSSPASPMSPTTFEFEEFDEPPPPISMFQFPALPPAEITVETVVVVADVVHPVPPPREPSPPPPPPVSPPPPVYAQTPPSASGTQTENRLEMYRRSRRPPKMATAGEADAQSSALEKLLHRQERKVTEAIAMYYTSRDEVKTIMSGREAMVTVVKKELRSPSPGCSPAPQWDNPQELCRRFRSEREDRELKWGTCDSAGRAITSSVGRGPQTQPISGTHMDIHALLNEVRGGIDRRLKQTY